MSESILQDLAPWSMLFLMVANLVMLANWQNAGVRWPILGVDVAAVLISCYVGCRARYNYVREQQADSASGPLLTPVPQA